MKKIDLQKAQTIVGGTQCEVSYSLETVNDKSVCYKTTTCQDKFGLFDASASFKRQAAASNCADA